MAVKLFRNYFKGLPDTRVFLYHDQYLDPTALAKMKVFSSISKKSLQVLLTDSNVAGLYLNQFVDCLRGLGIQVYPIVIIPGEQSKTLETYFSLLTQCADLDLDKESTIISFGGGVIKDLAGFLASTLFRGMNLVHVPTTVLAQVDAAIDWKQAVNLPQGKNLVGSMYSPSEIWVNTAFLRSLDHRAIRDGLSESIKIALCCSSGFLELLSKENNFDAAWLAEVVNQSISLKTENLRGESEVEEAVKQYGHAIGHAIEHLSLGNLGHGESIAIGMCVTAELGLLAGITEFDTVLRHYNILEKLNLPTKVPDCQDSNQIWRQIHHDKHFLGGRMYTGVLKHVGVIATLVDNRFMQPFSEESVIEAIEANRKRVN